MTLETLDPAFASASLRGAGFHCQPSELQIEAREECWVVRFSGQHLAWFAASATGLERLRTERRVLRLLEVRCSFLAPRVQFESSDGNFDVRTVVPGGCDVLAVYSELRDNRDRAIQLGAAVGAILAEQHSRIEANDVAHWLPRRPGWPEPREWVRERLPGIVDDLKLIARADAVMDAYESITPDEKDRALVHADVGLHNLAIDPKSFTLYGIFDYEGAAWADRHHDFQYLVFDDDRYEMLDAATSAYEKVVGRFIRRERVLLYHAACAVSFLANRDGIAPDERWCGRTLAEDLHWSRSAISRALGKALFSH